MAPAGLTVLALTGCDRVGLMGEKIAYIDISRILNDSSLGKQETLRNEQVKSVLLDAGKEARDIYQTLPEKEMHEKQAADIALLNQIWSVELQHSRAVSLRVIAAAAEAYREKHHLDLIVSSEQVLAAVHGANATDAIINSLKEVKVDYDKIPEMTVRGRSEGPENVGNAKESSVLEK